MTTGIVFLFSVSPLGILSSVFFGFIIIYPYFLVFSKLRINDLDKKKIATCVEIPLQNQTTTCFEPVVLNCPKGKFNDLATLFLVPQEDAIR